MVSLGRIAIQHKVATEKDFEDKRGKKQERCGSSVALFSEFYRQNPSRPFGLQQKWLSTASGSLHVGTTTCYASFLVGCHF